MIPAIDITLDHVKNARWISDRILVCAQPDLPEGINELAELGINLIVDLQGDLVKQETAACQTAGISFISLPLPGIEVVDPPEDILQTAVLTIEDPANGKTCFHCVHGKDRSGAVAGRIRIDQGATLDEALAEAKHYGMSWIEIGYKDVIEDYWERTHAKT